MWRESSNNYGHGSIANTVEPANNLEAYDKCATEWNFNMKYKTELPSRHEWNLSLGKADDPLIFYSDGSKTDISTGCGIYCEELNIKRSERLSNHSTVMQAETIAIKICAEEASHLNLQGRNVFIFSDSQAAIQAIAKHTIKAKTVKTCIEQLNSLGSMNNVTISWVPGHSEIPGNDTADELANAGAKLDDISMTTPVPISTRASSNKEHGKKLFKDLFNNQRGLKHSKMMMEPFKKGKRNLIRLSRKNLRVIIGILTGHSCLQKFLYRIGKADDPACTQCNEQVDEDMMHILTSCPALIECREKVFGSAFPDESELKNMSSSTLLKFARESKLYDTFFRDQDETT
jgi:ribonuclease HI